ncbi:cysteine desulfurase family protein [Indiicoccus explosivorum]|uniref:cysteine desulfurase family protein n=1 Tax=Indiicoccus explosivorum TaxID=1917864 RepID=UPI000B434256|nr:cysteine desulfurase family protein [Indiicoccus explosivorum]
MFYLDNSATTKVRPEVLRTFTEASENFFANPASLHRLGNEAEDLLEEARQLTGRLLGMEHIIFTSGGTEANNLAITGTARELKGRGKHIISSPTEHPSVLNTLAELEKEGFDVTLLPVGADGKVSPEDLRKQLRKDTILVTIMHVNNETGTVQPIAELARILQESRAYFHVDAVQSAGRMPLDFGMKPDLLTVSAHKLHGVKGSGVLAFNRAELRPILHGGGQEGGYRSGTVSVPHAASFAKALRLMIPNPEWGEWNRELRGFFKGYRDVRILSPEDGAPYILCGAVRGIKGEVLISALQEHGVIISTSSACSSKKQQTSHVLEAIGVEDSFIKGVFRISFGGMTSGEDIQAFKKAFHESYRLIKGETAR